MKNFDWKWLIIAALVVILAWVWYDSEGQEETLDRLERNEKVMEKELITYRNELNEKVAEIEALQYTREEMEVFQNETLERIEQISGKMKRIESYVKFESSARDTIFISSTDSIIIKDKEGNTLDRYEFAYDDEYMDLKGYFTNAGTTIDYTYTPSYEIVTGWKKPEGSGWFAKKRLMVDIVAENPNENISAIESIQVEPPRAPFLLSKGFWTGAAFVGGVLTTIFLTK